jgi:hypothetical protein
MKFRLLCFGSHLLISFLIALISVYVVFWVWYPSLLDKVLGVGNIFLLLLCIDVIIGPLLTLLVAKQGKKTLKMDLAVIAVLQIAALVYGLNIVAQGRPVWLVYDNNRFEVVQAYEVITASSSSDIPHATLTGPVWAAVVDADSSSIAKGDAYFHQQFLRPYDVVKDTVGAHAIPLAVLEKFNNQQVVQNILQQYPSANGYVPMVAKEGTLVVLVNRSEGVPIAIVDLRAW